MFPIAHEVGTRRDSRRERPLRSPYRTRETARTARTTRRSRRATSQGFRGLVSVVIPARNEARNIGWVLERMPGMVDEIILVDGGSTDDTIAVAQEICPDIIVVPDNGLGKGDAMRVGAAHSRGAFVVMIDADGSMDPMEIERYLEPLATGADFSKGSRFMRDGGTDDMTILRWLGHKALLTLSNILYGARWTDLCYGYCAFRRSALQSLGLDADGFEIETQMVVRSARHGLRIAEVPSYELVRRSGESNLNTFRDGWRVLRTIISERLRPVDRRMERRDRASAYARVRDA
jgi:glycosyltransferase involved in cell wall biosynthesis